MNASNFNEGVDFAFKLIFGIAIFFLVTITAAMIYFAVRYNRKKNPKATQIKDNMKLEIVWITVPTVLVLIMFYFGYVAFIPMRNVPKDAMEIKTIGKMWSWVFEYPNGKQYDTLVVPINKPIKLKLISIDINHSFYIPAFRIKEDVVPGLENNYMWFLPKEIGEFDILCAEYCGLRHSYMESKVRVVKEEDYKKWLTSLPERASEPEGLTIMKKNNCTGCHSVDGSKLVGPSLKGIYGKKRQLVTNNAQYEGVANDEYLKNSIFDPNLDVVVGFPANVMQSYKGKVTEKDTKAIIDYLKALK